MSVLRRPNLVGLPSAVDAAQQAYKMAGVGPDEIDETPRDLLQELIARRMAQAVVDRLETVQVDKQHHYLMLAALRLLQGVLQAGIEQQPVGQLGQRIMVGEKVSDHLLGKEPLARANDMPWIHPQWETAQR